MCGIFGIVNLNREPVDPTGLIEMGKRLVHRGPDGMGHFINGPVGLGQTRLAVIDLVGGKQPIFNEDRSIAVVFNGEIYNFRELRRELETKGHRFSTRSDTEVIVHLYETCGTECVKHLRGMFAFALWDAREGVLFVARDPLGKKPFYYSLASERLVFASELKAILSVKGIQKEPNPVALDAYLDYQFIPDPLTAFKRISKLPPGTFGILRNARFELTRYWTPPSPDPEQTRRHEIEYMEEFERTFSEAVHLRLVSDVPLGAFLSGGLDSSLIVAEMARIMERPVETYSIGFDDPSFDERSEAEEVAKALGTNHHSFLVKHDLDDLLPKLIHQFDEPFADSSAIPTYHLSKMARTGVTVALSGDGGDELFGGYRRYVARRLIGYYERIPSPLRSGWLDLLDRSLPESTTYYGRSFRKKFRLFLEAHRRFRDRGFLLWSPLFSADEKEQLYRVEWKKRLSESGDDPITRCIHEVKSRRLDPIAEMMWVDLQTYLPGDILAKVDRMSMAHGLEVRAPFLDIRLVEMVSRMPMTLKLRGLTTKFLLRRFARGRLPETVLRRPKKGFSVPLALWFKGPWKEKLRKELLRGTGTSVLFDPMVIGRLLKEHESGWRDHSMKLWGLLILSLWHKEHLE